MKHLKVRKVRRYYIDGRGYGSTNAAYRNAAKRRIATLISDNTIGHNDPDAPEYDPTADLKKTMGRLWPLHKPGPSGPERHGLPGGHIEDIPGGDYGPGNAYYYWCCPACYKDAIKELAAKLRKEDEEAE